MLQLRRPGYSAACCCATSVLPVVQTRTAGAFGPERTGTFVSEVFASSYFSSFFIQSEGSRKRSVLLPPPSHRFVLKRLLPVHVEHADAPVFILSVDWDKGRRSGQGFCQPGEPMPFVVGIGQERDELIAAC